VVPGAGLEPAKGYPRGILSQFCAFPYQHPPHTKPSKTGRIEQPTVLLDCLGFPWFGHGHNTGTAPFRFQSRPGGELGSVYPNSSPSYPAPNKKALANARISIPALGLLAGPLLADAQQSGKMARIGVLRHHASPTTHDEAFRQGLRDLGRVEGKNISFEYRFVGGKRDLYPSLLEELIRLKVDIIVTTAGAGLAARKATKTIPIVMGWGADAVENGLAASLARPGGNVTGLSEQYSEINAKLLELLHETLPNATQVAFLWNPTRATYARTYKKAQAVAPSLGLTIQSLALRHPSEIESLLEQAAQQRADALLVMGRMYTTFGPQIGEFAAKNRIPVFSVSTVNLEKHFGLLAYTHDRHDMFRRAATHVDKILKGAKPADLPMQLPVKFNMVVNLKTAKELGITIPSSILYRADKVIK